MANYLMQLFDPCGGEIHACRIELENLEYPDRTMDALTGLMTNEGGQLRDSHRFVIEGGHDPRAKYSVTFTRQ